MASDHDWTRLRDLFDRTAKLDADERARLLDRECGEDPDLRRRVENMLAAHDAAGVFLAAPTEPSAALTAPRVPTLDATDPTPGTLVGPYRLLQQIGEGGFGAVYMAEQQQPIVRKVALKVIKLGMDTKQVIARFEAERQALALMDHPNIARIFDAGTTEAGRPYFVMELVHGIPITEYCDRERLAPDQRLALFIPVCHAVAHAHQKGVIHRDLKPTNVLVTLHDGRPVPKVIDFGIARAIHQKLTERTLFTEYGQLIGTPEYMSPEQGEMSGLDIDTRTDIYSLGAVLYELLTGEKVFDPRWLRSMALREIQRVLQEEEPLRPSARVSKLGMTAMEIAQRRGVGALQLVRLLRGDPDWIVVKAIAKDRTRRYDSAGALAADIERYLRSEPVSASPPRIQYRVSRFMRRHRAAVAVVLVLVVSLVLGAAVATVGFLQARRAEIVARREARRSTLDVEAMRALLSETHGSYIASVRENLALQRGSARMDTLQFVTYLTNVVYLLERIQLLGASSAALDSFRMLLDREATDFMLATRFYDRELLDELKRKREYIARNQPERLADVLRKVVLAREQMGDPDSLIRPDRRAAARLIRERGARILADGRLEAAKSLLTEAAALAGGAGVEGRMELAAAHGDLGACLTEKGEYAAAESLLLEAYRESGAREQLMRLVRLYERWGRPEAARAYGARTQIASIRDLGALEGVQGTTRPGCGFSGKHGDRWIWVFGPSIVQGQAPTANVRWNSWSWTRDRDARDGIVLDHAVDGSGAPLELLSLAPGERALHDPADTWQNVSPAAVIEDPTRNRTLVLYVKIFSESGPKRAGASLAIWPVGTPTPRRVVVRAGAKEPTLLFQGDEPDFAAAAVVARDTLYLYGARAQTGLEHEIVLGRAPLAQALDRTAWRFYSGRGRWSGEVRDAVVILNAGRQFSVHWNGYLRKFVMVDVMGLEERIRLLTADRLEGPWSAGEVIHTAMLPTPDAGWVCRPAIHPELARESGRIQYFTYERPLGLLDAEVRLVEVVFR